MKIFIAFLLIAHGLITAAFSAGLLKPGAPIENPAWLSWWPTRMGQSWLLAPAGLERTPFTTLCGIFYLLAGAALVGAGLSLLGWLLPPSLAPMLALAGAGLCGGLLLLYLHPFYLIGIISNAAVLVAVLWLHWPSFLTLPA